MTTSPIPRVSALLIAACSLAASGCATEVDGPESDEDEDYLESEPIAAAGEFADAQVCIYPNENFGGTPQCWGGIPKGGQVTVPHLFDSVVGNDQTSSFKVKRGVKVQFFRDTELRGAKYTVNGFFGRVWDRNLGQGGAKPIGNDDVSSMVIRVMNRTAEAWDGDDWQVCLYSDEGYKGKTQCWGGVPSGRVAWVPTMFHAAVSSDQASSYVVNEGVNVTFYRDVDMKGTGYLSDGEYGQRGAPRLGATPIGNDVISSMRIEAY